jgi:hypothetical protein
MGVARLGFAMGLAAIAHILVFPFRRVLLATNWRVAGSRAKAFIPDNGYESWKA